MLFAIKRTAPPALLLALLIAVAALALQRALGLPALLEVPTPDQWQRALLCVPVVIASDAGLHGLMTLLGGRAYGLRYRALTDYFAPQTPLAMTTGGVLAGAEELLLRGVLLEGLRAPLGDGAALAASALVFGALHVIPDRRLRPFALWAVWEGALLGGVYLYTGSLTLTIALHAGHDIAGFALFAIQRRTGLLLVAPEAPGPS